MGRWAVAVLLGTMMLIMLLLVVAAVGAHILDSACDWTGPEPCGY